MLHMLGASDDRIYLSLVSLVISYYISYYTGCSMPTALTVRDNFLRPSPLLDYICITALGPGWERDLARHGYNTR